MKRLASATLTLLLLACTDYGVPVVNEPGIKVTPIDATCTEAWLKVTLAAATGSQAIGLKRDGHTVLRVRLSALDTVLLDDGLLPRRTYTYTAERLRDSTVVETSPAVRMTTLDTTSHEITWQVDTTMGVSGMFFDVAIINDTLAYAVGEMYLLDSTGQVDPTFYNLAVWNGSRWRSQRLYYQGGIATIRSVFAFSAADVWLDPWFRWDGQDFFEVPIDPIFYGQRVNKIWGRSSGSAYAVGDNGFIAQYAPVGWQPIESGTRVTLNDVWGGSNRLVGDNVVLVAAGNVFTDDGTWLLRIAASGTVDTIPWFDPIQVRQSVWFDSHSRVYTCGSGVYTYDGRGWQEVNGLPAFYANMIRGNGENDVFVAGDFGLVAHFNGVTWRAYPGIPSGADFNSLAVRNNLILAVGWSGSGAIVVKGTRTPH